MSGGYKPVSDYILVELEARIAKLTTAAKNSAQYIAALEAKVELLEQENATLNAALDIAASRSGHRRPRHVYGGGHA